MSDALPKWNMAHDEIAARNIVECYVLGKLSADESARFEEHFVDCPACLDRLEAAERFRAALKPVAGETVRSVPRAVPAPVRNTARSWRMAWPIAAAIVLGLGAALFFAARDAALRSQLQQAQIASLGWQRRYESERAAAESLRPQAASTFFLTIARGRDSDGSEPVNRVTIPAVPGVIVLSLEGELEAGFESVRASVTDAAGTPVWRLSGMPVTPRETLSVILPASVLHAGDYVLAIEGISASGRSTGAGRYRFRAR